MALEAGSRLGPYEIIGPLGAGGMGEVYKARDTRLNRIVAMKISRDQFSDRFEREARAVAALNHPHVCTLHDVGPNYLVMELVEGQPLTGPLPVAEALRLAGQIAGALDAAHRKGIVHRDLKPGNILVTKAGVKLLDFGLAKLSVERAAVGQSGVTVTRAITQEGAVVGTLLYMSPEQLEGREADARSDIFAFGAVLYEMLTGKPAFEGKSAASVIGSILRAEPQPVTTLAPLTPPALERVVAKCLAKDPEERWQSARDVKELLEFIAQAGGVAPAIAPRKRPFLYWGVGIAAAALVAMTFALNPLKTVEPGNQPLRFFIEPPPGVEFSTAVGALGAASAISPDGRLLVFVAGRSGAKPSLWLRPLDSLDARELPGTQDGDYPFWSADGKSIGFFADRKLKRIDVEGGQARTVCETPGAMIGGGSWSREGVILFSSGGVIHRVPAAGGAPTAQTSLDAARREFSHRWPQILPDGRRFIYLVRSEDADVSGLYAGSLDNPGELRRFFPATAKATYVPPQGDRPGYLLWVRLGQVYEGTLLAQQFDIGSLRVAGDPVSIAEEILVVPGGSGNAGFWVSDNGILAYRRGGRANAHMRWLGLDGKILEQVGVEADYATPRLSPDQRRVAFRRSISGNYDIWLRDLAGGAETRLTFGPEMDTVPVWSSDGRQIAFSTGQRIYSKDAGGSGPQEPLVERTRNNMFAMDWSRDGRFLLYSQSDAKTGIDLWVLPLMGDRKPLVAAQTPFNDMHGNFSPDGRWIAYTSDESGSNEAYVQPFPPSGSKWQVSLGGGTHPRWRGDGKALFYLSDGKMMTVAIRTERGVVEADPPRVLFPVSVIQAGPSYNYDVTADGQRFLVLAPVGDNRQSLVVTNDWRARLKP
jgi:Tol biopolymer transport system component/tRNA A-37 threonylcarbamoyl transferase component Bud32